MQVGSVEKRRVSLQGQEVGAEDTVWGLAGPQEFCKKQRQSGPKGRW